MNTWRGIIVDIDPFTRTYKVLSDRDYKIHTATYTGDKPPAGEVVRMPDGVVMTLEEITLEGRKLFSACHHYLRKRAQLKVLRQKKKLFPTLSLE